MPTPFAGFAPLPLLGRNDLQYEYSWSAIGDDDPRLTGEPDSALLNRGEGYEVLNFINQMAKKSNWTNKADGLKAERMIQTLVPPNLHSRFHIWSWMSENWNKYQ